MLDLNDWLKRAYKAHEEYMEGDVPDHESAVLLAALVDEMRRWLSPSSELEKECERCGECISKRDEAAEVPRTEDPDRHEIIHADCMRPGEEIA